MGEVVTLAMPRIVREVLEEVRCFGTAEPFRVVLARHQAEGHPHPLVVILEGGEPELTMLVQFTDTEAGRSQADLMGRMVLRTLEVAQAEWDGRPD